MQQYKWIGRLGELGVWATYPDSSFWSRLSSKRQSIASDVHDLALILLFNSYTTIGHFLARSSQLTKTKNFTYCFRLVLRLRHH